MNYTQNPIINIIRQSKGLEPIDPSQLRDPRTLPSLTADAPLSLHDRVPISPKGYVLPFWGFEALMCLSTHIPLYVYGPSGTGKSSLIRWIASQFDLPLYEVTGHSRLESPELIGSYTLQHNSTVFQDGPLTMAMRHGGIFLINELSLLDPSTTAGLNTVLDGQPLIIPETGEQVSPHSAFLFVATDNTNGQGDESCIFAGTLCQNQALMSRFVMLQASYMPQEEEEKLLEPLSLPSETVKELVSFANLIRQSLTNSDTPLTNPITPRDVIQWGTLLKLYQPLKDKIPQNLRLYTLNIAYINRLSANDRSIVLNLYSTHFED